ncbi:MAG: acyl-phosphate glycerol 3-phosphate acyltransferase [Sulfurovum sp. PC08-66]|nr:MAG: acyl-phosphate glycerol 3-phosphate acyltransferase [Sulfurovum sp. PC08-66]
MKKICVKIRFYYGAFIISFVTAVLMIPLIMLFQNYRSLIRHKLNILMLYLLGGKVVKEGQIDRDAQIYIMNHQGIVDIIALEATHNIDMSWVAKKELFDAPWFGKVLKYSDMISINRNDKRGLLKLLKDVKQRLYHQKRPIAIFPEGTRSNKQHLLPFKAGAKLLAESLRLRVQPIVITGSKKLLNEHNKEANSSTVHFKYLPTIDVASSDEQWYENAKIDMQREIDYEYTHHHSSR